MSSLSKIQWTDATWQVTAGCARVSPGCENCYAERFVHRLGRNPNTPQYAGLTKSTSRGPVWTGEVRTLTANLEVPLRWRKPRRIFVDSMSDLFHEAVPDEFIANVFTTMALASWHSFQILTKRADRMRDWIGAHTSVNGKRIEYIEGKEGRHRHLTAVEMGGVWPLPNVWLGVSVEDQERAEERIPHLLQTPAAVRFLSVEPLLGPVDVTRSDALALARAARDGWTVERGVDWIIVGGESGPRARPTEIAWIRSIVEQCREAKVPCFYKQGGASNACEHDKKGGCLDCAPPDLRVREFPDGI